LSDGVADWSGAEDMDFSSDEEQPAGGFSSRRDFVCFGYLFGRSRVSKRQYDVMREAENGFEHVEPWPSRFRLHKIRKEMMRFAAPVKEVRTPRYVPIGKGKEPRRLPDCSVFYTPFSDHIKRDFADGATASFFHQSGDARLGTLERPTEFFQTVVARDPSHFNARNGFRMGGTLYTIGCVATVDCTASQQITATLQSTAIAELGQITISPGSYAPPDALRVGDFMASFTLSENSVIPPHLRECFSESGLFTLRFVRAGSVYIATPMEPDGEEPGAWFLLPWSKPLKLLQAAEEPSLSVTEKGPYAVYVSLYGDEYAVHKRRRGNVMGLSGAYASLLWRTGGTPCGLWHTFLLEQTLAQSLRPLLKT